MDRRIYREVKIRYPKLKTWGKLRFGAYYRGSMEEGGKLVTGGVWFEDKLLLSKEEVEKIGVVSR